MSPRAHRLYWVYLDQKVHGPFTLEQIARIPGVDERSRVCPDGSQEWTTLGAIAAAAPPKAVEEERRCPRCGRRARPDAAFCAHCGTKLGEPATPAGGARRGPGLLSLLSLLALAAGAALSWRVIARRRKAEEPTGRARVAVVQVVRSRALRDVRGEERSPLPGNSFCLLTLSVRNPDPRPAIFQRSDLQAAGPDGRRMPLDGLTAFLPDELLAVSRLDPGAGIEGRVVFQAPERADKLRLYYGAEEVPISPRLLEADRRWRGQEERAIAALASVRCAVGAEKPRPLDPDAERKARQELGSLYHVDVEEYAFHVDLATRKVTTAPDADTLVVENTRRDCFEHPKP